ncbi:MAG: hypothetical protein DMG24_12180, partial [Acidobacteria bacterium]
IENYRRAAWLQENVDGLALRYLLQRRSIREADQIYRQATRPLLWAARYFRPLEREEHLVFVDATGGRVFAYRHVLDENAPGASLSLEQARALAERALAQGGFKLADFELQDSQAEKRKAREDYTFVWQAKPGDSRNVGDEHYRATVEIAGDQVVNLSRSFKLPEDWEREWTATRLPGVILTGIAVLLFAGLVGGAILLFVIQVRSGKVPWRASAKAGVFLALLMLLLELNRLAVIESAYQTSIPLSTYHVIIALGSFVGPLLGGLFGWLLIGFVTSLYPEAWRVFRGGSPRAWRRDAALAIALSVAAAAALARLEALVASRFHAYAPVRIGLVPSGLDAFWPGPGFFLHALLYGAVAAAAAAVLIRLVRLGLHYHAWWLWAGGLLLLVTLGPARAHSLPEFLLGWGLGLLTVTVAVGIVLAFFRNNILAYVGAAFCLQVAEPLVSLFSQPLSFFRWNGAVLALLVPAVLAWLLLAVRERPAHH